MPSEWVCRCGLNDMFWRHQERPHVDSTCRACHDRMAADGIDVDEWCKQVRDEWAKAQIGKTLTRQASKKSRRSQG